ncbi:hypothetical protein DERP_011267 [Dermatophagoides pteronyssinus]|uniref:Uncharacterized protein n=1 Tax=Dermatophagoides pteronyssinus TaxID=6956 RepID=A0ABQ8J7Q6_DERPT|nr:hypothetical protein DERP_011267 [Dermatophagoides pteronyssinus]
MKFDRIVNVNIICTNRIFFNAGIITVQNCSVKCERFSLRSKSKAINDFELPFSMNSLRTMSTSQPFTTIEKRL